MKGYFKGNLKLYKEIILGRLGFQNDFVGYETLIDYINKTGAYKLDGDMLEVGAFMGGGSRKLAHYCKPCRKNLLVIDVFDPNFDKTKNNRGQAMNWIYHQFLGGKNLKYLFDKNTKYEENIIVYHQDSKKVKLPNNIKLCFSFIDGNHAPCYVESDFDLAWGNTIPGGVVAFHDYGGDLPQVTETIERIVNNHLEEIVKKEVVPKKCIIFICKKH